VHSDILIVDAGDFLRRGGKSMNVDGEFILRGFKTIGYHAINVGENDLSLGYEYLLDLCKQFTIPFVSANLYRRETGETLFSPYIVVNLSKLNVAVFGIMSNDPAILKSSRNEQHLYIQDPISTAQSIVDKLSGTCDLIVGLSNLGYERSEELINQVKGIDVIISSHDAFDHQSAVKVHETILAQSKYQGQYAGDILLQLNRDNKISLYEDFSRPLNEAIMDDPDFENLLNEYRQRISTVNRSETGNQSSRPPTTKSLSYYMGSKSCQQCHMNQYSQWEKTKHAVAFKTIESEDEASRAECYPCHTTGFKTSNGFRNLQTTPDMINVQCEECHGTRFLHVRIQKNSSSRTSFSDQNSARQQDRLNNAINSATCTKCHSEERDSDFDYEKALKAISH